MVENVALLMEDRARNSKGGLGVADDDDREERDEDEEDEDEEEEEKPKPAPKKVEAKPAKSSSSSSAASASGGNDVVSELKKIRVLIEEGREQQRQYLWILFPIVAILLIQTILYATRL
jgi:hypothetical protein